MEIYVFDKNINLIGVIDSYSSYRQVFKYGAIGDFEIHLALEENTLDLIKKDNIIYVPGDLEGSIIDTVFIEKDDEGKSLVVGEGRTTTSILDRRINWGRVNYNGLTEDLMRALVIDNFINPQNPDRKIKNIILGKKINSNKKIVYQNSFGNIAEELEKLSNTEGLGHRLILDIVNKQFVFDIYEATDRSLNNSSVAPVIFSDKLENILASEYSTSNRDYKNTCLIAGQGEGEERKLESIEEGQGMDRYELYVDARDLDDKKDDETEIPLTEYNKMLLQRGDSKLKECSKIESFKSTIDSLGNNEFNKDFFLGDKVTFIVDEWSLALDTQVVEVERVYEEEGEELNITFGEALPTLAEKIKR